MKRFIEGEDRRQATRLPESLEDYVAEDNPVRVIDVFIDELDLGALGFARVIPEVTGRPAYHPATLLKIYLYGYLDRMPDAMTIRRQTVEHRFATLKAWMGSTHFLTKTLDKVKTEMSLQVLAYNMKRMINILGVKPLIRVIAT
jgi:transposase